MRKPSAWQNDEAVETPPTINARIANTKYHVDLNKSPIIRRRMRLVVSQQSKKEEMCCRIQTYCRRKLRLIIKNQ